MMQAMKATPLQAHRLADAIAANWPVSRTAEAAASIGTVNSAM